MSDIKELVFVDPENRTLTVRTGMNEIEWGYTLNTQRFPTYGGEIVQILSCYIDDLTILGEVGTYKKMEEIYSFFASYLRTATQQGNFVDTPITMHYEERGWQIQIRPKEVPGFRIGTEVVVPQWRLTAAVVDLDAEVEAAIVEQAQFASLRQKGIDIDEFAKLDDIIGYIAENPFSNPFPKSKSFNSEGTNQALSELADYFHSLIPAYSNGDFSSLITDGSTPLFLHGGNGSGQDKNPVGAVEVVK